MFCVRDGLLKMSANVPVGLKREDVERELGVMTDEIIDNGIDVHGISFFYQFRPEDWMGGRGDYRTPLLFIRGDAVSGCLFDEASVAHIVRLSRRRALEHIDFGGCKFAMNPALDLNLDMDWTHARWVRATGNEFQAYGGRLISQAAGTSEHLEYLDLTGYGLSVAAVRDDVPDDCEVLC